VSTDGRRSTIRGKTPRITALAALVTGAAVIIAGCSSSGSGKSKTAADTGKTTTVNITLTPQGCAPKPATVTAGDVQFNVTNKNASAVSEAELRTGDLSKILGEQENLTPGLSGGFELSIQSGSYVINCPGASAPGQFFLFLSSQPGTARARLSLCKCERQLWRTSQSSPRGVR